MRSKIPERDTCRDPRGMWRQTVTAPEPMVQRENSLLGGAPSPVKKIDSTGCRVVF